ncbi:MAG TPA: glycosyltransferase family 2 protein [Bacillota bacterium]|nr:glycosyltransferase family 2 protein [Bacillota bacterium]
MKAVVNPPQISILLPVYNTGQYLAECLESICRQTFVYFEVIAVDDGSSDNSLEILLEYSRKDPRIKVFRNETNRGVCYSLNHALKKATAGLVARVDSDDVIMDDRLAKQYAYFQTHPDCLVLGGQVQYINEQGAITGQSAFPLEDAKIKGNFFNFQAIADPTVMINRQLIPEQLLFFDEKLPLAEGLDLYFRLERYGLFANLADVIVLYRQRAGSLVTTDLKRTFYYIHQVRRTAVREYGIKAPLGSELISFCQKIAVAILPFQLLIRIHDWVKRLLIKVA